MSTATPRGALEGPVTPATLVALLRDARGFLYDAPRDGQAVGMRIDEALAQWHASSTWCFPIVCNPVFSDADIAALQHNRPGAILIADTGTAPSLSKFCCNCNTGWTGPGEVCPKCNKLP